MFPDLLNYTFFLIILVMGPEVIKESFLFVDIINQMENWGYKPSFFVKGTPNKDLRKKFLQRSVPGI